MRERAVLAITKLAAAMCRLLGSGGQSLPGTIADRLDPQLLGRLSAKLPNGIILVTGTNGKTSTTKLIAAALRSNGEQVLTNSTGANLRSGVTSALIGAADLDGRIGATIGLFEVDEACLRLVAPEVRPRQIVVLNLFRDQLDRYGEVDTTAALLVEGIAATDARVCLNADDALVASLADSAADPGMATYFGIERLPSRPETAPKAVTDSDRCPKCGTRLRFSRTFYSHLGHYACPRGDFSRPTPGVAVTSVEHTDPEGTDFTVTADGVPVKMRSGLSGTYNLYNAVAAVSVTTGLGLDPVVTGRALETTEAAFGRVEKVDIQGRTLWLLLIKNPTGFTQVLDTFLIGRRRPRVMMAVNDLAADGRDVSWLWDVPLEALASTRPEVVTAGSRAQDMALRMHYAGTEVSVAASFDDGIASLLTGLPPGGDAYILPTYTAMLQIRKVLGRLAPLQDAHA